MSNFAREKDGNVWIPGVGYVSDGGKGRLVGTTPKTTTGSTYQAVIPDSMWKPKHNMTVHTPTRTQTPVQQNPAAPPDWWWPKQMQQQQVPQQQQQQQQHQPNINEIMDKVMGKLPKPPQYQMRSLEELQAEAISRADLQVNPLIEALQRQKKQAESTAESRRQNVEAAYGNVGTQATELLSQAEQRALESAVARGGGRSGAVEHTTEKMSRPIHERVAQAELDKAAELSAIEEALASFQTGAKDQIQSYEERRSGLVDDYVNALQAQERALEQGNQQLALQYQQQANALQLELLPYLEMTAVERDRSNLNWSDLTGSVVDPNARHNPIPVAGGGGDKMVTLRDFAAQAGINVDYKPTGPQTVGGNTYHGNVVIGNREYTPQQLIAMGAQFDHSTQRWKIPQSAMQRLS